VTGEIASCQLDQGALPKDGLGLGQPVADQHKRLLPPDHRATHNQAAEAGQEE
jgi:hypothetical protein